MASCELYSEKKLAEKFGVTRERLRDLRIQFLNPGQSGRAGRETVITLAGAVRLAVELGASIGEGPRDFEDCRFITAEQKKNGQVAPASPQLEELTVKRIFPNVQLLLATTAAGREVRVRVRDNQNFIPKMKLKARPIGPEFYQMEGRCPRFKGRY